MPINSFLYPGAKVTLDHVVNNSLRFDKPSSAYLNNTPSSDGSTKKLTFSVWFKKADPINTTTWNWLIHNGDASDGTPSFGVGLKSDNISIIDLDSSGSYDTNLVTNEKLRDVSAWYHIFVAIDTTQSTNTNRVKVYLNGNQITSFATAVYPDQNHDFNTAPTMDNYATEIGRDNYGGGEAYFDGYMAEMVLLDGTAGDINDFGEFDSDTPTAWKPKKIIGQTFGTNGFHLEFKQTGTSANSSGIGADTSGVNRHFSVNNLTAIDQTTDTCTNNFATLNPLDFTGSITASEGNTVFQGGRYKATFGVSSGKWYWEAKRLNAPDNAYIGIKGDDGDWNNSYNDSYTVYTFNGKYYLNGSDQGSYGSSSTTNDILIFALDMDNGKFYIGENGTFYNSGDPAAGSNPMASSISGTYLPVVINNSSSGTDQYSFNFGNPSFSISSGNADANGFGNFEYAVPSGFFSLCSKNLAEFG